METRGKGMGTYGGRELTQVAYFEDITGLNVTTRKLAIYTNPQVGYLAVAFGNYRAKDRDGVVFSEGVDCRIYTNDDNLAECRQTSVDNATMRQLLVPPEAFFTRFANTTLFSFIHARDEFENAFMFPM